MARGRKKSVENMKPGEYFIHLFEEKTDHLQNMEVRFVQAAKVWKKLNECAIPYLNFNAFKRSYYESLKKV